MEHFSRVVLARLTGPAGLLLIAMMAVTGCTGTTGSPGTSTRATSGTHAAAAPRAGRAHLSGNLCADSATASSGIRALTEALVRATADTSRSPGCSARSSRPIRHWDQRHPAGLKVPSPCWRITTGGSRPRSPAAES